LCCVRKFLTVPPAACWQVSSTHQSQRDIANLQRALLEAKKREESHKRLILKIQNQKKQIEDQHNSLVVAAHNLQTATTTSSVSSWSSLGTFSASFLLLLLLLLLLPFFICPRIAVLVDWV